MTGLKRDVAQLGADLEAAGNAIERAAAEAQARQLEAEAAQAEASLQKFDAEGLQIELEAAQAELGAQVDEAARLAAALMEAARARTEAEHRLRGAAEQTAAEHRVTVNGLKAAAQKLEATLAKAVAKAETFKAEGSMLRGKVSVLESALIDATAQEALEADEAATRAQGHRDTIAALTTAKATRAADDAAQICELEANIANKDAALDASAARASGLADEAAALNAKIATLETANARQATDREAAANEAAVQSEQLKSAVATAEAAQAAQTAKAIAAANNAAARIRAIEDDLAAKVKALTDSAAGAGSLSEQLADLTVRHHDTESGRVKLQTQLSQRDAEVARLASKLDKAETGAADLDSQLQTSQKGARSARKTVAQLEASLDAVTAKQAEMVQAHCDDLANVAADRKASAEALQAQIVDGQSASALLTASLAESTAQAASVKQELAVAKTAHADSDAKKARRIAALESETAGVQGQLAEMASTLSGNARLQVISMNISPPTRPSSIADIIFNALKAHHARSCHFQPFECSGGR